MHAHSPNGERQQNRKCMYINHIYTRQAQRESKRQQTHKRSTKTHNDHKEAQKDYKETQSTYTHSYLVFICFLPCSHMEGCLLHACAYSGKVFHLWAGVKFTAELKVNITLCSRKQVHLSLHVLHHRPRRKPVGNLEEKSMATASTSKSES